MFEKLKVGVIGIGGMGYLYSKIIKQMKYVELVSIFDINEKARTIAIELSVDFHNNIEDFFNTISLDAVIISCPDEFHKKYAVMALERNINVHLEKPVAHNLEDCSKILEASKKSSSKLNIGYISRVVPQYNQVRNGVKSGEFGDIIHFYIRRNFCSVEGLRWKSISDLPTVILCHDADLIMWITGNKIVRVYAEGVSKIPSDYDVHDSIQVVLKCSDNSIGVIECSWALPNSCGYAASGVPQIVELVGTKGISSVELQNQGLHYYNENGIRWHDMIFNPSVYGLNVGSLRNEIEIFFNAILNDCPVMCTIDEGIEANKVFEAVKLSLKNNEVIYIKDIK